MRTPRSGRLGLLGVGAVFALVASALSPVTANAAGPTAYEPGITIQKVWSSGSVNGGGIAVATITINNTSGSTVNNVAITDIFDPGLVYQPALTTTTSLTGTCALDNAVGFRRVNCTGLTVPTAGVTLTLHFKGSYWGYRHFTKNYLTDERLEIQKQETHVDIQSGETKTAKVTCDAGYDILDYSWHLQQVDQDTGDFYDVYLWDSNINNNSATVELFNDAGGKAQGKLWALCLKNTTNHGHSVGWGTQQVETHVEAPDGPHERPFYAECAQGYTPVAINMSSSLAGGGDLASIYEDDRVVQTGLEADGSRRAIVWAVVKDHSVVTLKWRCLATSIGVNRLWFNVESTTQAGVPWHDKVAQKQITCDHGYKGIIGGWRGGKFNGSEPRPITRVYWLWHDDVNPKNFTGKLLCLQSRLMRGGKVKKTGVSDLLNNHSRGTTQNGAFYIYNTSDATTSVNQVN